MYVAGHVCWTERCPGLPCKRFGKVRCSQSQYVLTIFPCHTRQPGSRTACSPSGGGIPPTQKWFRCRSKSIDPDYDAARYSIHDFTQCESFAPSSADVEFSAAIDGVASRSSKRLKIAIVAANAGVSDMVSRYLDTGLSPYLVKFFASLEEAREWVK